MRKGVKKVEPNLQPFKKVEPNTVTNNSKQ